MNFEQNKWYGFVGSINPDIYIFKVGSFHKQTNKIRIFCKIRINIKPNKVKIYYDEELSYYGETLFDTDTLNRYKLEIL